MRLIYTDHALESLERSLSYIASKYSPRKALKVRDKLFARAATLLAYPESGQVEEYLSELELGHRRLIEGHHKIIYRLEQEDIIITDIFDTRQDPDTMGV